LAAADARVQEVADALTAGISADPGERDDEEAARWLLAQLLSWHRREKKAAYWDFFRRMGLDSTDLTADKGALGSIEVVGPIGEPFRTGPRAKPRQLWRYAFPAQDYDLGSGRDLYDPRLQQQHPDEKWSTWKVRGLLMAIDDVKGTLDLGWYFDEEPRHPEAIVPLDTFRDIEQREALLRLGEWVAEHGIDAPGAWRAARDLLLRRAPRSGQASGDSLRLDGEDDLDSARRLVERLDRGTLAIQGPPGSGKTYTGARMIVQSVASGKKVGISANSHKVIGNFLRHVEDAAAEAGVPIRAIQKVTEEHQAVDDERVTITKDNARARDGIANDEFDVAAGTAWLWASGKSDGLLDMLFVDEAGQMSLANVLAMAGSARSIVLLGDPQQLDQPLQGSHPPGADRSALGHLLGDHDAMPDHLGLFLEHTWRLHPDVTRFTSEGFYEGRLASRENLSNQRLQGPEPMRGAGLRLIPADHVGADSLSRNEARQVAGLVTALVESGSSWIDKDLEQHALGYDDVLVVAPYNAQVGAIAALLPPGARVGTVDKFQGQEAPVSIYSMTSSSPEDAPRGMSFLYSRNRLNVATSRARCIAVVVAEPALLRVRARTPEQMRLANALCQFVEMAAEQARA
ncbi:MAG: DEAD/DEAH box helicase, partial [Candidatus Limnocylindria bacterium]